MAIIVSIINPTRKKISATFSYECPILPNLIEAYDRIQAIKKNIIENVIISSVRVSDQ
jgi:hypothetical protein